MTRRNVIIIALLMVFGAFIAAGTARAESNGRLLADCMEQYVPIPSSMSEGSYEDAAWDSYWSGEYAAGSPTDACAAQLGWAPIYPYYTTDQKVAALQGVRGGMTAPVTGTGTIT